MAEILQSISGGVQNIFKYWMIATVALAAVYVIVISLGAVWQPKEDKVLVMPFKIISSGELNVSKASLAKLTELRLNLAKERVLLAATEAKTVLGVGKDETVSVQTLQNKNSEVRQKFPDIDPALLASLTTESASEIEEIKFSFQGIDLGGLVNWVLKQFKPRVKTVQFSMIYECASETCDITIWGDIKNLGLEGEKILWVRQKDTDILEGIDLLAYRIVQFLAAKNPDVDDASILKTKPEEFRKNVEQMLNISSIILHQGNFRDPQYMLPEPKDEPAQA